jgi:ribonuclease-3
MARMKIDLSALEARVGHSFSDPMLLRWALTHVSAAPKRAASYERLEFLGDRVLGLIIAHMLFETYPDQREGELSRRLAALVRKETCAEVAEAWGVGPFIRLGDGEAQTGGRKKQAILGDSCEAIIGAVYMDAGLGAAKQVVSLAFGPKMHAAAPDLRDAKTALQEWAQARHLAPPRYLLISRGGPDHAPCFEIAVELPGFEQIIGLGGSKRAAEQAAATAFMAREQIETHPNKRGGA